MGIPSLLLEMSKHCKCAAFKLRVLCFMSFVSTLKGVTDQCETTPLQIFLLEKSVLQKT